MNGKKVFYEELAYIAGIILLAIGTVLMEKADFGMSMVVAPAYVVFLKLSQYFPWFTFGTAEYCLQAVLLIITALVMKRFKVFYLFSFITAVVYGLVLDSFMFFGSFFPCSGIAVRIAFYIAGLVVCAAGVAMLFHTYIAPEAYELLVKEISSGSGKEISVVKTVYDCCSCAFAVIMSFLFFGLLHFEGVKLGTIICAIVNGKTIGLINTWLNKRYDFRRAIVKR